MNIYDEIGRNRRETGLFIALFIIFFLLAGIGMDTFRGAGATRPFFTVAAFLFALISSLAAYAYGDRMILAATSARRPRPDDHEEKQWQNVVEEMSLAAGIPPPRVYVIDDPNPNAFATGRDPRSASIAATSGLLRRLNREELEGVAAHEMSHVRNYDVRLMLIVTVLAGAVVMLADWAIRSFIWSSGRRRRAEGPGNLIALIIWLIAIILAPVLARVMALFISRKREYLADASGAELTRNPLGLARALEKISDYSGPSRPYSRALSALWIENRAAARGRGWQTRLFATHPPVERRVELLRGMAYVRTRQLSRSAPKVS